MKWIAQHRFGTSKMSAQMTVVAFNAVTSLFSVMVVPGLPQHLKFITTNPYAQSIISVLLLTIGSSLLLHILGLFLQYIVSKVTLFGWPHYFVYVFEFEGEYIIGRCKIYLDCITKPPAAKGQSYLASPTHIHFQKKVEWRSIAVTGGSFRGENYCYIIYGLDYADARNQNRPYEEGLLVFHLIEEDDSTLDMPDYSVLGGKDRYIGRQLGIDRNGIWNFAYAEEIKLKDSTISKDKRIDDIIESNRSSLIQEYERLKIAASNP
jgi:hypothetical protein